MSDDEGPIPDDPWASIEYDSIASEDGEALPITPRPVRDFEDIVLPELPLLALTM